MVPLQAQYFLDKAVKGLGDAANEVLMGMTTEITLYLMGIMLCAALVIFILLKEAEALDCPPTILELDYGFGKSRFFTDEISKKDAIWDNADKVTTGKILKGAVLIHFDTGSFDPATIDDSLPCKTVITEEHGFKSIKVEVLNS